MVRWRPMRLLIGLMIVAASSQGAWGASAAVPEIFANTLSVRALARQGGRVFAATGGGVEEYDGKTLTRVRVFTTNHGLPQAPIRRLSVEDGKLFAVADGFRCERTGDGFRCAPGPALPPDAPGLPEIFQGTRVTARLTLDRRELVGTAEKGLWLLGKKPRLLTPTGALCGNHVMAMAEFAGEVWLGTFDEGVCRYDGTRFSPVKAPFRMVNDMVVAAGQLYVATTVGLFRTADGARFSAVALFDTRGVNDLALDGDFLWATSPATLWKIPVGRKGRPRGSWIPAGTSSLQAVDARNGQVWLATEDRGMLRLDGKTFQIVDRAAGMPSSWVVDVAVDDDGGAYAATLRDGVVHVDKAGKIDALAGLPDPWLLHVSRGSRGLWVGTQGGVARVDGKRVTPFDRLPNPCVHAVLETERDVWVATENGVAKYSTFDGN